MNWLLYHMPQIHKMTNSTKKNEYFFSKKKERISVNFPAKISGKTSTAAIK